MSECKKCREVNCGCSNGAMPVQPPLESNTPACPNPEPCPEVVGTECILYLGDNVVCGEETIYENGDNIEEVLEKITDHFCQEINGIDESIDELTQFDTDKLCGEDIVYSAGDTVKEALDKTVDYFCEAIGGDVFLSVTYSELTTLIAGNLLEVGKFYLINDFQTIYDQPDYDSGGNAKSPVTKTATISPIFVYAVSSNTLDRRAYQPEYPQDIISYDVSFSATEVNGSPAKGRITERIDNMNNRTDYDHRTVQFIRYETSYLGSGVYESYKETGFGSQEFYTFNDLGYDNNNYIGDTFIHKNLYGEAFGLANNVFGAGFEGNRFDTYCRNNTFGQVCRYNKFEDRCYGNLIRDNFYENTVLTYFNNNTVTSDFYKNTIGHRFQNNEISNLFGENHIGNDFQLNVISGTFRSNLIGNIFQSNYIYSNFGGVSGADFGNLIGDRFYGNTVSSGSFRNNVIGVQCESNTFLSLAETKIGDYFVFNTNVNMLRCRIGVLFLGNTFSSTTFRDNIFDLKDGGHPSINTGMAYNSFTGSVIENNVITAAFRYNTFTSQAFRNVNSIGAISGFTFNGASTFVATTYSKRIESMDDGNPILTYVNSVGPALAFVTPITN